MNPLHLIGVVFGRNFDGSWDWSARGLDNEVVGSNVGLPSLGDAMMQVCREINDAAAQSAPPPKRRRRRDQ